MINNSDEGPPYSPSDLRQWLDLLGAQLQLPTADRQVVFQTVKLIAMVAQDAKKPLPEDVFAAGLNDNVARLMLSSACMMAMRFASIPQAPKGPQIIAPNGRPL